MKGLLNFKRALQTGGKTVLAYIVHSRHTTGPLLVYNNFYEEKKPFQFQSFNISSDAFSAIPYTAACVLEFPTLGIIDASTILKASIPITL